MDCITCGQPILGKNYARHIEQCFTKKEGTTSISPAPKDSVMENGVLIEYCNYFDSRFSGYCIRVKSSCPIHGRKKKKKVNKNQVGGCPTSDFAVGYCERLKRQCTKHLNWETIKRLELDNEWQRQKQLLKDKDQEIRITIIRIERRKSAKNEQHVTIEENV